MSPWGSQTSPVPEIQQLVAGSHFRGPKSSIPASIICGKVLGCLKFTSQGGWLGPRTGTSVSKRTMPLTHAQADHDLAEDYSGATTSWGQSSSMLGFYRWQGRMKPNEPNSLFRSIRNAKNINYPCDGALLNGLYLSHSYYVRTLYWIRSHTLTSP